MATTSHNSTSGNYYTLDGQHEDDRTENASLYVVPQQVSQSTMEEERRLKHTCQQLCTVVLQEQKTILTREFMKDMAKESSQHSLQEYLEKFEECSMAEFGEIKKMIQERQKQEILFKEVLEAMKQMLKEMREERHTPLIPRMDDKLADTSKDDSAQLQSKNDEIIFLKTAVEDLMKRNRKMEKDIERLQEEQIHSSQLVSMQEFEELNDRVLELEQDKRITGKGAKGKKQRTDLGQITDDNKSESDDTEEASGHDGPAAPSDNNQRNFLQKFLSPRN